MEITNFPQSINHVNRNISLNNKQTIEITEMNDNKQNFHSSIKQLISSKVIYQNPLLMASAVENYPMDLKPYQPDVTETYKVNPVKAIYDSNKAHD
jgi:TnpA family transposase